LVVLGCQTTSPTLDSVSIQNTAAVMANTAVAQTSTESVYLTAFLENVLTRSAGTPVPKKFVSHSTNGDFEMSWNIYNQ
jgi:hypothetical protein